MSKKSDQLEIEYTNDVTAILFEDVIKTVKQCMLNLKH